LAVLPVGEGSIEHSWQVTGLRATGSDTLVFDGVFVPGYRLLSFPRMVAGGYAGEHPGEPLYGATVINALTVTVVAPLLGMTEAALDRAVEQLGADARKPAPRRAGSASVRTALAEAASRVDTARLRIRRALDDIEHGIRTGSQLAPLARARVSMDAGTAAENLREAMRLLLTAVGSGAFSLDQALQRTWRDVEISLAHSAISPDATRAAYGHALLNTAAGG
jgi:alkylation response protein AidB-like acyl-CoA dehydrogenase